MTIVYEARYYQIEAEQSILDYYQSNRGNVIIAMPTGTGKSLVIANFIKNTMMKWPSQRFLVMTHVKELIEQNADKLLNIWPNAPLGIYSAGLKKRDKTLPVIFGGVDSIKNEIKRSLKKSNASKSLHFGHRDIIIIDECHLVDSKAETRYNYVLNELKKINKKLVVIGLTATPYRLKDGLLTNGNIFNDICYDITSFKEFNKLLDEKYLSPLISKSGSFQIDTTSLKITGNDFNQKQLAKEAGLITLNACKEVAETAIVYNRQKILIFASGIEHGEYVTSILQSLGIKTKISHSKLSFIENQKILNEFKSGDLTALVNYGKFTTGFDCPQIDMIVMLRATASPGLWVQMLGRGTRPCEFKEFCLVLDFGGNAMRLGPINDVKIPGKKQEGIAGDPPVKKCPNCEMQQHPSVRFCLVCGFQFEFKPKIKSIACHTPVMKIEKPVVEWMEVQNVTYSEHKKQNSPPIFKVKYHCGLLTFDEYICLEHSGYPAKKARDWWRKRHNNEPPQMVWEAVKMKDELKKPIRIRIRLDKKYPEILGFEF